MHQLHDNKLSFPKAQSLHALFTRIDTVYSYNTRQLQKIRFLNFVLSNGASVNWTGLKCKKM